MYKSIVKEDIEFRIKQEEKNQAEALKKKLYGKAYFTEGIICGLIIALKLVKENEK